MTTPKSLFFSTAVMDALKQRDMTHLDLSTQIHKHPETIRNICKGSVFPGPQLLIEICGVVDINATEMQTIVDLEREMYRQVLTGDPDDSLESSNPRVLSQLRESISKSPREQRAELLRILNSVVE